MKKQTHKHTMLSKYEMTMAVALRTEQLRRGIEPRVVASSAHFDPLALALKEMEEGVLPFEILRGAGTKTVSLMRPMTDCEKRMLKRLMGNMRHYHRSCLDGPQLHGNQG